MRTILNLFVPLWLLIVAALVLGGWLGLNAYRSSQRIDRLTTHNDSLALALTTAKKDYTDCQQTETRIATDANQRIENQQLYIKLYTDSVSRLRLPAQVRLVQQVSGAEPVPTYLLPPVQSHLRVALSICYDSTAYQRITRIAGELYYRRSQDTLRAQADVRKDRVLQQSANVLLDISQKGLFHGRRKKAERQYRNILIWARREQSIQNSLHRSQPPE